MADVAVPRELLATADLPPICAITGAPADGAVSVRVARSATGWRGRTIRVPLSQSVFTKWARRQRFHLRARVLAASLTAAAIVVAFRNGMLGIGLLALAAVVHIADLRAERMAQELQPSARRDGDVILLDGVHEDFAAAVAAMSRSNPD